MMNRDFIVVGSGLSGLVCALKLADQGRVALISKDRLPKANSAMAQGGIASVTAKSDSFEDHIRDTLEAGAGLCNPDIVRQVVEEGPQRVSELSQWGVQFDLNPSDKTPHLHREGGHSQRRILHIGDHTGRELHKVLSQRVMAHPQIEIFEDHMALDLIMDQHVFTTPSPTPRCRGLWVWDKQNQTLRTMGASAVVLATGGAGKVFLYTSNWDGATGDGIAMAFRAGARVANLEFTQFHPTCLYHKGERNFLISEALRGEGGRLINSNGDEFISQNHPLGSLAPRDIVARAIDSEMKKSGSPCVYLDLTHLPPDFSRSHFPDIYEKCLSLGFDFTKAPLPVVPASHYLCGGILSQLNGTTDVPGLYAIGECAHTGLHGANRLASNSLLECLVSAHLCAEHLKDQELRAPLGDKFQLPVERSDKVETKDKGEDELVLISHLWSEIRTLMWNYVGIVRSDARLKRAQVRLKYLKEEIEYHYHQFHMSQDLIELRNLCLVSQLTVECALRRKESRGIHYNLDYPETRPDLSRDTLISPLREFSAPPREFF